MGKQNLFGFRVGLGVVDGFFHSLCDIGFHHIPVLDCLDGDSRNIVMHAANSARDKELSSAALFRVGTAMNLICNRNRNHHSPFAIILFIYLYFPTHHHHADTC